MKTCASLIKKLDWKKGTGLIPCVVQNMYSKEVLMLGYMSKESLQKTYATGRVWFYSRSRKKLWMKGEESGNYLQFLDARDDCDADTLLIFAAPSGPTCHTGNTTCFGNTYLSGYEIISDLLDIIRDRKVNPQAKSYTSGLFKQGLDRIIQKVGEESVEVVIAAKGRKKKRVIEESVDLIFHLFVLLREKDIEFIEVLEELSRRRR